MKWEEHRADYADRQTYGYTQFCENYRRFAKQLKRSMRQVHRAGEKLFVDYAGPTIGLTDGSRAHIFVAALGASSYTFACATPHETMKDWLESTARALAFIGGVPQLIVPDNPKAMIADANRYEPRSNDTRCSTSRATTAPRSCRPGRDIRKTRPGRNSGADR
jgi:transposase